jgi:hypothetical protein
MAFIFPPGEPTSMWFDIECTEMLCFVTNWAEIKKYDAPESNKTDAGAELTRNIPNTMS